MTVVSSEFVSSSVKRASYDSDSRCLVVEFATGRVYRYQNVPSTVYDWLVRAKSKGAFVTGLIKDRYEYQEITPDPPEVDLTASLTASLGALHGQGKPEEDGT